MPNSDFQKFPWKRPRSKTSLEIIVFTSSTPFKIHVVFYIISSGDAIRSRLKIFFNVIKKQLGKLVQKSTKRLREHTEHLTPGIMINNSCMSTIMQEEDNINSNLLTEESPPQNHNTDWLAIKLNRLTKIVRYNSHRDFLLKCIQENFLPKELEIPLEQTIANFDQDFVDNLHTNLRQSIIVLMKQIVTLCGKTEQKTQKH